MISPRPTELAHVILRDFVRPGSLAVDATAGNGHDTLFLAKFVGPNGRVIAYDIQPAALESTREKLESAGLAERVTLLHRSHATLAEDVEEGSAEVVMFNLGYLPGQDHGTTTRECETLVALEAAESALCPGGVLSVVCYPGHPGGDAEAEAVEAKLRELARHSSWRVARYGMLETKSPAPFLLVARKPGG